MRHLQGLKAKLYRIIRVRILFIFSMNFSCRGTFTALPQKFYLELTIQWADNFDIEMSWPDKNPELKIAES